jgi:hypothetical protein
LEEIILAKVKTVMPHLIGLDIGFGQLKWMSNQSPVAQVIPSGVLAGAKVPDNKRFSFDTVDVNNLVVSTDDGTYFVGKYALDVPSDGSKRTQINDRANDPASRVLFQTGIGLSLPHESGDYEVFVVTGLPNADYDLSIREHLESFLNRSFSVTFHLSSTHTITKNIKVVGAEVVRQPEGAVTYSQLRFDKNTFLDTTDNAREMVGLIDAGHFTTDYALFRQANIIEDSNLSGSTVAVTSVYNNLKTKLISYFDEFGFRFKVDDKKLDTIIRTGVITYAGKEHDVSHLVEEASREVAKVIAKNVLDAWGDEVNSLESIILTGGGAYVFAEYLKEEFEARRTQGFSIIENPEFSNVTGFYMYGAISLADTYSEQEILDQYVNHVFLKDVE